MDTYNNVKLCNKTVAAAILRKIDREAGTSDRTIPVTISQGRFDEEVAFDLKADERVQVVSSRMGRDGYFGKDEDIEEFETVGEAFDHAGMLWGHLTSWEKKKSLIEVQIVGPQHGAELDNGDIGEDVRGVIAVFDPELPGIIAEMFPEEDEE